MKTLWLLPVLAGLFGCMSTRLTFDPKFSSDEKTSYEDYVNYYVMGFVGRPELNLQEICMDQKPYAVEWVKTATDTLISVVTVGIYTPATTRVWCGD